MEKPVEEYIRATFSFLRVLKESERSRTMLAAKEDGKLVVVREIYATGLPYKEIKAIEHPFCQDFLDGGGRRAHLDRRGVYRR